MAEDHYIPVFNWPITELMVAERMQTIQPVWQHIEPLVTPGLRALDLCCGSGAAAFLMEERGAQVTAIDSSPLLIEQARAEAAKRESTVEFIRADVLGYKLDEGAYGLAVMLGNPLLDFPPARFDGFRQRLAASLSDGGRLVMEYYDGLRTFRRWTASVEKVTEKEPEEIVRRFVKYDPERGAIVFELDNRTRDECCTCHCYIYTMPLVRLLLAPYFTFEQSHNLGEGEFLDVYERA